MLGLEFFYGNYDVNGNFVILIMFDELLICDYFGCNCFFGLQCFVGFLFINVVDVCCLSVVVYFDIEFDFIEVFFFGVVVCFENYFDFGFIFNYKLMGCYKISNNFVLCVGISMGFCVLLLYQIYFSCIFIIFNLVDGVLVLQEVGVFVNIFWVVKLLGIFELKEEIFISISVGFIVKVLVVSLCFIVDVYQVGIDDWVVFIG